jgi:hypothetical protein
MGRNFHVTIKIAKELGEARARASAPVRAPPRAPKQFYAPVR